MTGLHLLPHNIPAEPCFELDAARDTVCMCGRFDSFYSYAKEEGAAVEGICRAGELLFVPRGDELVLVQADCVAHVDPLQMNVSCNLPSTLSTVQAGGIWL